MREDGFLDASVDVFVIFFVDVVSTFVCSIFAGFFYMLFFYIFCTDVGLLPMDLLEDKVGNLVEVFAKDGFSSS